jgi:hypothetical protein
MDWRFCNRLIQLRLCEQILTQRRKGAVFFSKDANCDLRECPNCHSASILINCIFAVHSANLFPSEQGFEVSDTTKVDPGYVAGTLKKIYG